MSTSAGIQDRPGLPLDGTCCAPLRGPITAGQAADLARRLQALADPPACAWRCRRTTPWSPRS
ncbi:MAG TPA: hypothetical protein VFQ68_30675 [Streptosporangiaceae bacterium]|nr:hypothetical protein [Streptosporangiaceae bacterium]